LKKKSVGFTVTIMEPLEMTVRFCEGLKHFEKKNSSDFEAEAPCTGVVMVSKA
jgi:hypothetical protein